MSKTALSLRVRPRGIWAVLCACAGASLTAGMAHAQNPPPKALPVDERTRMRFRNMLTRSLGDTTAGSEIDILQSDLRPGDIFMLCSDGLSNMLSAEELLNRLNSISGDPREVARQFVATANERGGPDNISVVLVRVLGAAV